MFNKLHIIFWSFFITVLSFHTFFYLDLTVFWMNWGKAFWILRHIHPIVSGDLTLVFSFYFVRYKSFHMFFHWLLWVSSIIINELICHVQFLLVFLYVNVWTSLVAQLVTNPPAVWQTWIRSLCWEDPLDKGTATHS